MGSYDEKNYGKNRIEKMNTSELKPIVFIGKQGVTGSVISEIKEQLKNRKLIKVKILRSAREEMNRKEIAENVVNSVGAKLVELRGNTFILSR